MKINYKEEKGNNLNIYSNLVQQNNEKLPQNLPPKG